MSKRAAFIVVEGLDRSGKSTQTALLQSRIEALRAPVQLLKFPDRTTAIGQMINSYLQSKSDLDDRAIHLLFAANRWELAATIEQLLKNGTTVICDRYAFSGVAFSTSKGLPYEWCRAPEISLPAPDLTLFLHVTPEAAKARGGYGEERYEKEEMQRIVGDVFQRIGLEMKRDSRKWIEIDADQEKEVVAEVIWKIVQPLLGGVDSSLQRLWIDKIPPS